jgi:hypothetical protein
VVALDTKAQRPSDLVRLGLHSARPVSHPSHMVEEWLTVASGEG